MARDAPIDRLISNETPSVRQLCKVLTGSRASAAKLAHDAFDRVRSTYTHTEPDRWGDSFPGKVRFRSAVRRAVFDALTMQTRNERKKNFLQSLFVYYLCAFESISTHEVVSTTCLTGRQVLQNYRTALSTLQKLDAIGIQVIEDEPLIALMIEDVIEGMKHHVIGPVGTVEGAVLLGRTASPGLILCDITLADGSGIDAVQRINRAGRVTPVVFVSGWVDSPEIARLPNDHILLAKPYPVRALRASIWLSVYKQSLRERTPEDGRR